MAFSFISAIFSSKSSPEIQGFLKLLWFSSRIDWISDIIEQLVKIEPKAHIMFLNCLEEKSVTQSTSAIIKKLLIKYYSLDGLCLQVSKMLHENTAIGRACAFAIGVEKSNDYYHKLRALVGMEQGQWRKFLSSLKSHEFKQHVFPKTLDYICGLFNEPLNYTCKNPSSKNNILSLYKGHIYRNKHLRTPIEVSLDIPFSQKDFHFFVEFLGDEPIVIITKHIDKNVIVPNNFYLVFTETTQSFGERILPYIGETYNLLDMISKN